MPNTKALISDPNIVMRIANSVFLIVSNAVAWTTYYVAYAHARKDPAAAVNHRYSLGALHQNVSRPQ